MHPFEMKCSLARAVGSKAEVATWRTQVAGISARRLAARLILFLTLLAISCVKSAPQSIALREGFRGEYDLVENESYQVSRASLSKGDYIYIVFDQISADICIAVDRPDGSVALEVDNQSQENSQEIVTWIADKAGPHVVRVESCHVRSRMGSKLRVGRFAMDVKSLHPSSEEERQRNTAETLYLTADRLWRRGGEPNLREAIGLYDQSLSLFRALGDLSSVALVLNSLGLVYAPLGETETAIRYYRDALDLYKALGDPVGEADNLFNIGQALTESGQAVRALPYLAESGSVSEKAGDNAGKTRALFLLGNAHWSLGNGDLALGFLEAALAISVEKKYKKQEADILNNMALIYLRSGELQKARGNFLKALAYYENQKNKVALASVLSNLGMVSRVLGDTGGAMVYYGRCLEIARALQSPRTEAGVLNNIGFLKWRLGEFEESVDYYNQALPLYESVRDRTGQALVLENTARSLSALGRHSNAISLFEEALEIRKITGDLPGEAFALQGDGGWRRSELGTAEQAENFSFWNRSESLGKSAIAVAKPSLSAVFPRRSSRLGIPRRRWSTARTLSPLPSSCGGTWQTKISARLFWLRRVSSTSSRSRS
ncbi:MAG: tetratricopeptide repeat protein [Verrucomicrobiae bacterium]|nr:tetratricopeptide repeat protein [Verrucomicrobiae bacterium]